MSDAPRPAPDGDGASKRSGAYLGSGVLTIALGIVTLFIDGLEVLPWMLIPGGALWIIIGLSQRRDAGRPRAEQRRDDGGATPVIGSDTGSGTGRGGRADDHASDPGDGGGFGGGDGGGGGGGD